MTDIIIVDTYKLNRYAQRITDVNIRISRLDDRLHDLYWEVGLSDLWDLIIADSLTSYSWRLARCQSYLTQTASDFELTEQLLGMQDPTDFNTVSAQMWFKTALNLQGVAAGASNITDIIKDGIVIGYGVAEGVMSLISGESIFAGWPGDLVKAFWRGDLEVSGERGLLRIATEDGETYVNILSGEYSVSVKPEYGKFKDDDMLNKYLGDEIKQEKIPLAKDMLENTDERWYKKDATILEEKTEMKLEGSVIDGRMAGSNDFAEGSIESKLLTGEVHAGAAGGLYVYSKDKDGNIKRIFSPGVSAEVGASFAAVDFEADGRVGFGEDKNMLGVYGNFDAEVLSAEGKAKIAVNSEEVYAGLKVEADLAKISAAGGVAVLGTDVGVTGSLKVGVGAHAEAGYTDGKFKVDIGAAVGVGFDLGFEVDVSGTVDAVCGFAYNTWESVTDAWDWLF